MKPRYRVTSAPVETPFLQLRLQQHAIMFKWWVTKENELLLTAGAYTIAMAVRK